MYDRDGAIPQPVRDAWRDATEHWDEPARHETLLALVAQHAVFAWAAARYKERAGDPVADRALERLRKAATATLLATATARPPSDTPYKKSITVLIVLVLMLGLGLIAVAVVHNNRADHPARRVPAAEHP